MQKIRCTGYVRKEEVLQRVKKERNILPTIQRREDALNWSCIETAYQNTFLKER